MRGDAERLVEAVTHGRQVPVGSWRLDLGSGVWSLSESCSLMLGLARDAAPTTEELFEYIHPDDRAGAGELISASLRDGVPFNAFYRINVPRGLLSVLGVGEPVDDDPGHGPVMVGYLVDLTPPGRRRELDRLFNEVVADLVLEQRVDTATVMEQAQGLLMSVLDVDLAAADALMTDGADRLRSDIDAVARHLVDHFERGAGITRSMTQLRLEVDDVLQRDDGGVRPRSGGPVRESDR